MAVKKTRRVAAKKQREDSTTIGARIRNRDKELLRRMAKREGVGISTYVRLIIEQYLKDHAASKRTGRFTKKAKSR